MSEDGIDVFITGVGSGIGYELVKYFLSQNINVIGLARKQSQLARLQREIANLPGKFYPVVLDLKSETIKEEVKSSLVSLGVIKVDILINNAGSLDKGTPDSFQYANLLSATQTNFIGPYLLTLGVIPFMQSSKIGHIVNIASMAGFQDSIKFPGLSVYSALKAAVIALTQSFALEFAEFGIHVNALALGSVSTKMLKKAFPGYTASMTPQQIVKYIADFSLTSHQFLNGKVIPVATGNP